MGTVSYHNQPAIHKTLAHVPEDGYAAPYTVKSLLWGDSIHRWIAERLIGVSLHICCGKSKLGNTRLDLYEGDIDIQGDAARLPFADRTYDTVLIDPPYNGKFQWNHDMLSELARIARQRIIFQHWFLPCDRQGRFKKAHRFQLTDVAIWQPKTYFGRVQVITIMDSIQEKLL